MSGKDTGSAALVTALDANSSKEQSALESVPQSARQTRLAAFTPGNLTEAIALSKLMASSDMVPKDYRGKAANILLAMQFGSEVGLAPLQALQSIAVINGRPALWGDGALALVMAHPDFEDIQEITEGTVAKCTIRRRGRTVIVRTFSDKDAADAGLLGKEGPWKSYRARMRQMRARGFALRDAFADALKGIAIAEEAMDLPVDTSQAKTRRDTTAIDVADAVASLTPSEEPNRGHEDTGLKRADEQSQAPAKPDNVMCSECRQINGHSADCPVPKKQEQDRRTSKPTEKALYLVLSCSERFKKGKGGVKGARYLVLEVVLTTQKGDQQGKLYVWHKSLHEYFPLGIIDKRLVAEVSEQDKDGKKFFQLDHIIELGGLPFVDDKPAQQGTLLDADPGPVPDEEWDEDGEQETAKS